MLGLGLGFGLRLGGSTAVHRMVGCVMRRLFNRNNFATLAAKKETLKDPEYTNMIFT